MTACAEWCAPADIQYASRCRAQFCMQDAKRKDASAAPAGDKLDIHPAVRQTVDYAALGASTHVKGPAAAAKQPKSGPAGPQPLLPAADQLAATPSKEASARQPSGDVIVATTSRKAPAAAKTPTAVSASSGAPLVVAPRAPGQPSGMSSHGMIEQDADDMSRHHASSAAHQPYDNCLSSGRYCTATSRA